MMTSRSEKAGAASNQKFRCWQVGKVKITKIVEAESLFDIPSAFPKASEEEVRALDWLHPHFVTPDWQGKMSIHALVVETPQLRILVDTCIGNDRNRLDFEPGSNLHTSFIRDFEAAGFTRESIDVVLCTHLHFDHVGWNTMQVDGEWVPTFPNARYLFNTVEYDHWLAAHDTVSEGMFQQVQNMTFIDSIKPVVEAGLVDLVDEHHRVCDEIRFEPSPGHSPGHVCVRISSEGQQGYITGDILHHPAQFANVEWGMASVDFDSDAATATRERVFGEVADTQVLVIGTHFAGPTAGKVKRDGSAYRFDAD